MFDPFGDYETRGYLRNFLGAKDTALVKTLEHVSFQYNVQDALIHLSKQKQIGFEDMKTVHHILFKDVYPWAGEDRSQNATGFNITKGNVFFQFPQDVGRGAEFALQKAADPQIMREKPGEILGELAYAHPFLDGNGRTILTTFSDLCRRAEMHIDWRQTHKADYLNALTMELHEPYQGHLDQYLKPYIKDYAQTLTDTDQVLQHIPGLSSEEKHATPNQARYTTKELIETLVHRQKELGISDASLEKLCDMLNDRAKFKVKKDDLER